MYIHTHTHTHIFNVLSTTYIFSNIHENKYLTMKKTSTHILHKIISHSTGSYPTLWETLI